MTGLEWLRVRPASPAVATWLTKSTVGRSLPSAKAIEAKTVGDYSDSLASLAEVVASTARLEVVVAAQAVAVVAIKATPY